MTCLEIINARLPGYSNLCKIIINDRQIIEAIEPTIKNTNSTAEKQVLDDGGDCIS